MGLRAILKKSYRLIANKNWTGPNTGFPDAEDNAGTRVARGVAAKERMGSQAGESREVPEQVRSGRVPAIRSGTRRQGVREDSVSARNADRENSTNVEYHAHRCFVRHARVQ